MGTDARAGDEAIQTRMFLVRLSGRQTKRTKPVTFPALLDGLLRYSPCLKLLNIIQSPN